jgi:hypothetical protein
MISFDVLLRSPQPNVPASAATLEQIRPATEVAQGALRWLERHGVRGHDLQFSLACQAPRSVFEKLFAVTLKKKKTPAGPAWVMSQSAAIPSELAASVEGVSIAPPPTYFG